MPAKAERQSDAPRITKDKADYKSIIPNKRRCGTCVMYVDPGRCTLVKGLIDPLFSVCKYWEEDG